MTTTPRLNQSAGTQSAWHFTGDTLRDGRPIPPIGEWLVHEGPIVICESGLHASERLIDALRYAPGDVLHRVTCRGVVARQDDKLVSVERRIDWSIDAGPVLRTFARRVALDVAHLWDMPSVVREFLETGRDDLRDTAWAAARDAAEAATWATAEAAAWAAARGAAWDVAWAAATYAARAAARVAVRVKYNAWLTEMVEAARAQEV